MASSRAPRKGRRRSPWVRRLKLAITLFCLLFSGAVIGLFSLFMVKYREAEVAMSSLSERMARVSRPPSRVLTADNQLLYQVSEENRIPLKLGQIPKHVQMAILAAEDKRFYDHAGVDAVGLMRAFTSIFKEGRVAQGGSTITMQLAKRLYSGNERSFMRKVQDIAFATAMEREIVNKNRILELYLNEVYFGEGAHGIGAAAKIYFNKTVDKLTISDAAMLARCVRLPSRENPISDLDIAMRNRDTVLGIMREEKMISAEEYQDALAESPRINKNPPKTTAFYPAGYGKKFVQHVLDFIKDEAPQVDLKRGGYTVYTTLDSRLQKLSEQVVRDVVRGNRSQRVTEGAFVAVDRDGKVICEVGGVNPMNADWNLITQWKMQPGSAFKAVVYSTALRENMLFSANDMVSNAPVTERLDDGKFWTPRNSARWETASQYTLKTSFAASINLAAINTSRKVGYERVVNAAHEVFGFRSDIRPVHSIALGVSEVTPLEMAEAYSVFMLQGDRVRPYPVTRIVDEKGEVVKAFTAMRFPGVLSPAACGVMDEIMHETVLSGTARATLKELFPEARGKTGTTNDAKDAWFCGYVDGVLGIGWVGNSYRDSRGRTVRGEMASSVYGGTVTTLIWKGIMKSARERFGAKIEPPSSLVATAPTNEKPKSDRVVEIKPKEEEPVVDPTETAPDENKSGPEEVPIKDPATPAEFPSEVPPIKGTDPPPGEVADPVILRPGDTKPAKNDPPPKSGTGEVMVEICVDSGRRATIYCPETVQRSFSRNSAPKGLCRIHGTDDGLKR